MERNTVFWEETQLAFRTPWFWIVFAIELFVALRMAIPQWFGSEAAIGASRGNIAIQIIILVSVPAFFAWMRLETSLSSDGICYRFPPLIIKKRKITPIEIAKMEVVKYHPILEYGGWGYRKTLSRTRKAYSLWGRYGLKATLLNGSTLMIGTRHPDSLRQAVVQYERSRLKVGV